MPWGNGLHSRTINSSISSRTIVELVHSNSKLISYCVIELGNSGAFNLVRWKYLDKKYQNKVS